MTTDGSRFAEVSDRAARRDGVTPPPSGPALPDGCRLVVSFTYSLLSGWGLIRNPSAAVWIEDAAGEHVRTLLVQGHDGLRTMAQWYAVLGTTETTTSSTKPAGSTSIEWDGTDEAGGRVAQGDYHVCIEASRDNGPRELIRHRLTLGTARGTHHLPSAGELVSAAVFYSGAPG
ncbi:MAG: DUF2271 domain-containing protein [Dermatophilaceae bacterium]